MKVLPGIGALKRSWVQGSRSLRALLLLGLVLPCGALGQTAPAALRVTGGVSGGGGTSSGGGFTLRGGIVSPGGQRSIAAGVPGTLVPDFRLTGGLFSGFPVRSGARPRMGVVFTADKLAELSWDVDISEWILEFTSSVGPEAQWLPVDPQPKGSTFTTPCQQPARYFRLRER